MQRLGGREKMSVHDLFVFYGEYITTEYDFMNKLTLTLTGRETRDN